MRLTTFEKFKNIIATITEDNSRLLIKAAVTGLCLLLTYNRSFAQNKLNLLVTVREENKAVKEILQSVSAQGKFYFSYSSHILKGDSVVSINLSAKTVREVLDNLLGQGYQYKETGNYIIIQRGQVNNYYTISGYVVDKRTGEKIGDASVYEKSQLISTFTNEDGFFRLRLRDRHPAFALSVSKVAYADTSVTIQPGYDQQLSVAITPTNTELAPVLVSTKVERTWLGRLFVPLRQKRQSLNIGRFFADKPFQVSLVPGLASHGLNTQVINKLSINILGGYAAGANGLEIAGIFNIDKGRVNGVQMGGVFNIVGGKVGGVQLAGIHNNVFDSLSGVQLSGFSNLVKGAVKGVQLSGSYNVIWGSLNGVQGTSTVNLVKDKASGVQLAGIGNISRDEMRGVQIAGLFNYTKHSKGVQIALINIADTSSGYSIGLINIVKKGYQKLSVYANEVTNFNLAYKSGNRKLYSILLAGMNISAGNKAYTFGYGIGNESIISPRISITTELTSQNLHLGDWNTLPDLYRVQPALNIRISKKAAFFGGPTFSIFHSTQKHTVAGYKAAPAVGYPGFNIGADARGWFGWHAGINFF
ncbi:STN and carboxypeptidase regulatory-like domain-containing protein [Foetidibacter luteolus]|uniref:STN and carboxypeptidase regulatory-like domain-containing protein n=1 Tax=Foetidibacter luteolus TaxID=2608880 RepID=UPI00129B0D2D|nr:STN and carboxypeptidase regulatory-like domain-containing protein [Foetidibacter luteolus]